MTPIETVVEFLQRINEHVADRLADLMTEDHLFIDSLGNRTHGRETLRTDWRSYYALCPDYRVSHDEIFENGNKVAAFGRAGGTMSGKKWQTPAAWFAVVENGLVSEWRVYADNKPVYDIIAGRSSL